MLPTNLATRPFYNVRLVRLLLGLAAAILVAATVVILSRAVTLRDREGALTSRATDAQQEAGRLRREAEQVRARVDLEAIEAIAAAAREANAAIEKRAFSWTSLLDQVERALPDDVRVSAVQPRIEDGTVRVALTVEAQRSEALSDFVAALEREGRFRDTLPTSEQTADDDVIDAVVEGRYVPPDGAASEGAAAGVEVPAP